MLKTSIKCTHFRTRSKLVSPALADSKFLQHQPNVRVRPAHGKRPCAPEPVAATIGMSPLCAVMLVRPSKKSGDLLICFTELGKLDSRCSETAIHISEWCAKRRTAVRQTLQTVQIAMVMWLEQICEVSENE